MKSCENCQYCLLEDYGYSNYTTEGTLILCLKRLHPEKEGFDRWYGEDNRLNYAERCPGYVEGEPIEVDVDHEKMPYLCYTPNNPRMAEWWFWYIEDEERRQMAESLDKERHAGKPN